MPRIQIKQNEGRDFYDDHYDSDDQSIDNALDFSKVKFIGRKKQLSLLKAIWNQVIMKDSKTTVPFPLLAGHSGCGKSKLLRKFIGEIMLTMKSSKQLFLFLTGKNEQSQCADPFSAIKAACRDLCNMPLDEKEKKQMQERVSKALGKDGINTLLSIVPDLIKIIGDNVDSHENATPVTMKVDQNTWNQIKYAFETFFKSISTRSYPVVMFLDDLQWADSASLDLIVGLLTNSSIKHFLLVGAVRSNEVNKDHPLTKVLEKIENFRSISTIEVENLSLDELGEFLAEVLHLEQGECISLTEFLYEKTRGNPFFSTAMLGELNRRGIVYYDLISFEWKWDLENKDLHIGLPDDVVDVVAEKIRSLPEKLQNALTTAAYMRSTFDAKILQKIMEVAEWPVEFEAELVAILNTAVLEGILSNSIGSKDYKFAHDRFQQAAYSLVGYGNGRNQLRERIGRKLYALGSMVGGEDWMLFVAANHLNASIPVDKELFFMIKLNFDVGKQASLIGGFSLASLYLHKGLSLLQTFPNHWNHYYDTSLQLYQVTAKVELILGNFDEGNQLTQQLFKYCKNENDKLESYISLVHALGCQALHADALKVNWNALKIMGDHKPGSKVLEILKGLISVKLYFRQHSDDDILKLPVLTDEIKCTKMKIYDDLIVRAYYVNNDLQFVIGVLRSLKLSFKFGLVGSTASAFIKYGFVLMKLGDVKGALRLAGLSKKVLEKTKDKKSEAFCLTCITLFLQSGNVPLSQTMENYKIAYNSGMENGDIELGCVAASLSAYHLFMVGCHLETVLNNHAEAELQALHYNNKNHILIGTQIQLSAQYLSGRKGMSFDWTELKAFGRATDDNCEDEQLIWGYTARLCLAVHFGELSFAQEMVEKVSKVYERKSHIYFDIMIQYYSGLAASSMARIKKRKKYTAIAKKFSNDLKKTAKARGENIILHKQLLMDAEILSLRKCATEKVQEAYRVAIDAAINASHINDAALGNELAGEYCLSKGDENMAKKHFTDSRNMYKQWGALAKVFHLQKKFGSFIINSKVVPIFNMIRYNNTDDNCSKVGSFASGLESTITSQTNNTQSFEFTTPSHTNELKNVPKILELNQCPTLITRDPDLDQITIESEN